MDKDKNKGLADTQDGEFILNESSTSVSIDTEDNFFEEGNADKDINETDEKSSEQKDTDSVSKGSA